MPLSGSASGSVPSIRNKRSEAAFSTTMNGKNRILQIRSGPETRRASPSACWIVYSFGTISPTMLCTVVISR